MFTVSAKFDNADTWFLLVISVIVAELRLVGEIASFKTDLNLWYIADIATSKFFNQRYKINPF